MGTMGSIKLCFLALLPGEEVVLHTLHIDWGTRSTGMLEGPVMKDLLGEGMLGPMGIDCRSRSSSRLFLES